MGESEYTDEQLQGIEIGKANQTSIFGAAPTVVVDASGTVSATGGASGNPVTFTSQTQDAGTAGGTNGSTIDGVAAGTCTITANQAGNADFKAAAQTTQGFAVGRLDPDTWLQLATQRLRTGCAFALDLRLNSRGHKVGAYAFQLTFDPSRLQGPRSGLTAS